VAGESIWYEDVAFSPCCARRGPCTGSPSVTHWPEPGSTTCRATARTCWEASPGPGRRWGRSSRASLSPNRRAGQSLVDDGGAPAVPW